MGLFLLVIRFEGVIASSLPPMVRAGVKSLNVSLHPSVNFPSQYGQLTARPLTILPPYITGKSETVFDSNLVM